MFAFSIQQRWTSRVRTAVLSFGIAAMVAPLTQHATAATFNFDKLATTGAPTGGTNYTVGVGEGNWNTKIGGSHIYQVGDIGVVATASGNSHSRAYLDGPSGGKPAGLGVCSLSGSCAGSSDDNVGRTGDSGSIFESLILTFTSRVKITDLDFRNRDHNWFNGKLNINGTQYSVSNGDLDLNLSDTVFVFTRIAGTDKLKRDFYLSALTAYLDPPPGNVPEVPLPPAALLFGSVLAGGGLFARWRRDKMATADADC